MSDNNHDPPGFAELVRKLARTGLGVARNRGELAALEFQEERARGIHLFVLATAFMFFAAMALALVTAVIIFACPAERRLYVFGAFILVYLAGAVWAGLRLKEILNESAFAESLNQLKKDREWVESFK